MAAGYKDFTAGATLAAADLEDYCELQGIMRFSSSSARDTALSGVLTEGLWAYLIDTNSLTVYTGSAWSTVGPVHGALTAWTPTVTQSGSVTVTVNTGVCQRIGRTVFLLGYLTVTGSGSAANAVIIGGLPYTALNSAGAIMGNAVLTDTSAGLAYPAGMAMNSTTSLNLTWGAAGAGDVRLGVVGFTAALANTDVITFSCQYVAAADA